MGVSNFEAIVLFLKKNVEVTILDKKNKSELGEKADLLESIGAKFICGENYLNSLKQFDIIIRSPGVYFYDENLQNAIKSGTVVTSEMELFFDFCPCKIIAITGSDGKTTTSTLIAKILQQSGYKVHLGGNIGKALLCELENIHPLDIAVVELSSFQLLSMRKSPNVAVITNISRNHLDVHTNMEEYIKAKTNIFIHQNAFGKVILNLDNTICNAFSIQARGFVQKFSVEKEVKNGAFFNKSDEKLYYCKNNKQIEILKRKNISILGTHNIENFLAAIAATFDLVDIDDIQKVAKSFKGIKHRLELIKMKDSIKWYNDSIATSPTRTIAALKSFEKNVILIAGGYDKNLPFDALAEEILKKVKILILMGSTSNKIKDAVLNSENYDNSLPIFQVSNMEMAVKKAKEVAKNKDYVLHPFFYFKYTSNN